MQLRNARLCLDCDEVHEESHCPVCASESFAFIKRWVPASERRGRPAPPEPEGTHRETVKTYKEILAASGNEGSRLSAWQLVRGGAVSLALLGAAGWLWRRNAPQRQNASPNGDAANNDR
jgi:predicted  nucleic acid-binding Zn-ribbon protein